MCSGNEDALRRKLHFFLGGDVPIRLGFLFEVPQDKTSRILSFFDCREQQKATTTTQSDDHYELPRQPIPMDGEAM
jgi:hypothetical protein